MRKNFKNFGRRKAGLKFIFEFREGTSTLEVTEAPTDAQNKEAGFYLPTFADGAF